MKIPTEVRELFRQYGRAGGTTRAERLSAHERSAIARLAAVRRWTRARFGEASFASLGLPGAEIVDEGLADLAARRQTVPSLVVSLAAPRLRREGVPIRGEFANAEELLYRTLEATNERLAHSRYLAHLRQAMSFADACHLVRVENAK